MPDSDSLVSVACIWPDSVVFVFVAESTRRSAILMDDGLPRRVWHGYASVFGWCGTLAPVGCVSTASPSAVSPLDHPHNLVAIVAVVSVVVIVDARP